jgi:hypothetical protein
MYQVRWLPSALNEFADQWIRATFRRASSDHFSHLGGRTKARRGEPVEEGESRPKGRRITFVPPLALTFRVGSDEGTVTIVHVRVFRRRQS